MIHPQAGETKQRVRTPTFWPTHCMGLPLVGVVNALGQELAAGQLSELEQAPKKLYLIGYVLQANRATKKKKRKVS